MLHLGRLWPYSQIILRNKPWTNGLSYFAAAFVQKCLIISTPYDGAGQVQGGLEGEEVAEAVASDVDQRQWEQASRRTDYLWPML